MKKSLLFYIAILGVVLVSFFSPSMQLIGLIMFAISLVWPAIDFLRQRADDGAGQADLPGVPTEEDATYMGY